MIFFFKYMDFLQVFFQFLTLFWIFVSWCVCLSKLKERVSVGVGVGELLSVLISVTEGLFIYLFFTKMGFLTCLCSSSCSFMEGWVHYIRMSPWQELQRHLVSAWWVVMIFYFTFGSLDFLNWNWRHTSYHLTQLYQFTYSAFIAFGTLHHRTHFPFVCISLWYCMWIPIFLFPFCRFSILANLLDYLLSLIKEMRKYFVLHCFGDKGVILSVKKLLK